MGYETILFIGPNYKQHKGGISAVLEVYSHHMRPFKFIASYDGNYKDMRNAGLFVACLFKVFVKLLLDGQIQIVHMHGSSNGSFYRKYLLFLMVKYVFRKKVVYHMHGGSYNHFFDSAGKVLKAAIVHFVNRSDAVICLSNSWKTYFKGHFKPKLLRVINNPIELLNELRWEKVTTIHFLFLGKICDQKGVFDLLSIIKENKAAFSGKAMFTFGGNGEVNRLVDFVAQNNLEEIVRFKGWVSGQFKHQLLAGSNVYILPSYVEGLPISILEAMNYGLPVISTNVGGIPEILYDHVNGFLVTPGDKEAIRKAIEFFMEQPAEMLKMGLKARKSCSGFAIEAILPHLEQLYETLSGVDERS